MPCPTFFTKARRSAVIARIRSTGNRAAELRLIALFRAHGITRLTPHPLTRRAIMGPIGLIGPRLVKAASN